MANFYEKFAKLNADNPTFELDCPGAASAVFHLTGNFTGTIRAVGRASPDGPLTGRRILFIAGFSTVGDNTLELSGAVDTEWFTPVLGSSVGLEIVSYVSGELMIYASASEGGAINYIDGSVQNSEELAVRAGRAFVGRTGIVSVQSAQKLKAKLTNPADSGRILFLNKRIFGNGQPDNSSVLEYRVFANPTNVLANTVTPVARRVGSGTSSALFTWANTDANLDGTEGTGGFLPPSRDTTLDLLAMILPGNSVGFSIQGAGGNLQNSARLAINLYWYEENII